MLARQQDGAGHTLLKVLPPLIFLSADVQPDSPPIPQSHPKPPVKYTLPLVSNNYRWGVEIPALHTLSNKPPHPLK